MTSETLKLIRRQAADLAVGILRHALREDMVPTNPNNEVDNELYTQYVKLQTELRARGATAKEEDAIDLAYHQEFQTVEIAGIHYAYDVFTMLGGVAPVGSLVRLVKRNNGTVTLRLEAERTESEEVTRLKVALEAAQAKIDELTAADEKSW